MPKVSIIIPVYNAENHLSETVSAVCHQTLTDIEILLIDDGSTDNSPALCDALKEKDARIRVIHQKNQGVSAARNTGIDAASGDYIGFCDADDQPDADMYEYLLNIALEHDAEFVMIKSKIIHEDGKISDASSNAFFCWEEKEPVLKFFLTGKLSIAVYTKLIRADLGKKIKFESGRKINEDKMYVFDALCLSNKICFSDVAKYKYYRRAGSSSLCAFSEKFFDILYFAEKIENMVSENYPSLLQEAKAQTAVSYLCVLRLITAGRAEKHYKDEYNKISAYLRSLDRNFCRTYLPKKDYMKWFLLKLGMPFFKTGIKLFSKN